MAVTYRYKAQNTDGKFITAAGAGVCIDFGLKCVEVLSDIQTAQSIKKAIQA